MRTVVVGKLYAVRGEIGMLACVLDKVDDGSGVTALTYW